MMFCIFLSVIATEKEEHVMQMLDEFNSEFMTMSWLQQSADWSSSTNLTNTTATARSYAYGSYTEWMRSWKLWARNLNHSTFPAPTARTLSSIASGIVFMDEEDARQMSTVRSKMTTIYNSVNIVLPEKNITIRGEDDAKNFIAEIKDPLLMKKVWKSWRTEVGNKVETLFLQQVNITNKAARENGYHDIGVAWRAELGMIDVVSIALTLWEEVKGFYLELHAFTRHQLFRRYGTQYITENEPIPVHLLGSLWGENWKALTYLLMPDPKMPLLNVTESLISKGYTVEDIFQTAETFYTSMGMTPMGQTFWRKSMFVKPHGRIVDCHAASYDFSCHQDFRIRMCGEVNEQTLNEAVHEMGHIEYYMAYDWQPMIYRNGANSAFHEAVGETMVYAAQSSKCLKAFGIVDTAVNISTESSLNLLMKQALSKFVFLPWALTVDLWRYELFSGNIQPSDMTAKWWQLRNELQGVKPPDEESSHAFDPGSKYHVINNMPYMRYFFSRFLEHQFLHALCSAANQDIHSCCFVQSKKAGNLLKRMLSLGASVSWQDALESLTGQRHLSSAPMIKYYQPLYDWIKLYNRNNNISISWLK